MVKYVCKNTGSQFDSKEELKSYLFSIYGDTIKDSTESDIYDRLKNQYPKFNISMQNGNGWYANSIFTLYNDSYSIIQYYGNESSTCSKNPNTYEELINEIDEKMQLIFDISKEVLKEYKFKLKNAKFTYGYSEDEHSCEFVFTTTNGEICEYYYPYSMNINEFVTSLKKYIVTSLEGKPSLIYDDGYFAGYEIDGVDISLIMNANKVKLEIIN